MSDYRTVGAHQINKWLWSKLWDFEYKPGEKAFAAYAPNGSINLVPFIPTQQQPQFTNIAGGAPFVVYNYIMSSYTSDWWMCREQCAYVIYDNNEERLRAIHTYMTDLLRRMDWTAKAVNNNAATPANFDFKYVQLTSATGPDEYSEDGGRQGAMAVINYEYTVDLDPNEGMGLRV